MRVDRKGERRCRGAFQGRLYGSCLPPVLLFSAALTITGCTNTVADHTPAGMGGLSADAPTRATMPSAYPAVNDVPPSRSNPLLSAEEQKNLEDELAQARDRAAPSAGTAAAETSQPTAKRKP